MGQIWVRSRLGPELGLMLPPLAAGCRLWLASQSCRLWLDAACGWLPPVAGCRLWLAGRWLPPVAAACGWLPHVAGCRLWLALVNASQRLVNVSHAKRTMRVIQTT